MIEANDKLAAARQIVERRKLRELAYEERQRQKIPKIAVLISVLVLFIVAEYAFPPVQSLQKLVSVEKDNSSDRYFFHTENTSARYKIQDPEALPIGASIEVYTSPVVNDVHHLFINGEEHKPAWRYYDFLGYPFTAALLLIFSAITARYKWKYWFHFWIFGLIGVFVSAVIFVMTRL